MRKIDLLVQSYISAVRTESLTAFMYLVSRLFDISVYSIILVLCIGGLIYMVRSKAHAFLFVLTLGLGGLIVYLFKVLFNIDRPTDMVESTFGKSFPSYHAAIAVIFFVLIMYIFDPFLPPVWRWAFHAVCIISIFVVAFSRVYLGVHWTSDVLAGIVLGAAISYAAILIFNGSYVHGVK